MAFKSVFMDLSNDALNLVSILKYEKLFLDNFDFLSTR